MKFIRFIDSVKSFLGLKDFEKSTKEKSIKKLLEKLKAKKKIVTDSLKINQDEKEKALLQEELEIISKQIKKGKKLLKMLKSE